MQYVAIFHANLNYAYLTPDRYEFVIRKSYELIFDTMHEDFPGVKFVFEASGYTIEQMAERAPDVLEKLKAAVADGACEFMGSPHAPQLDPPRFTFTAWIRLDRYPLGKDARRWIVCKAANEWTDHHISLFVDGRNVSGYLNIGGGQANCHEATGTGDPLPLDRWTAVAMTYDGEVLRVFCDGKEVGSQRIGKARTPGSAPLTIGARSDRFSTFDCGDIDEVRLFDRALSGDELGRADELTDGLVRHWDFEQLPGQDAGAEIAAAAGLEPAYRNLLKVRE